MSDLTWEQVEQTRDDNLCHKCGKTTTGAFNPITQKCLDCHIKHGIEQEDQPYVMAWMKGTK